MGSRRADRVVGTSPGRGRLESTLTGLALLAFVGAAGAQGPAASEATGESGKPLVRAFGPADYDGHQQNWDVTQDAGGVLWVANSDGLLAFDGARWRLIEEPHGKRFYSLLTDSHGHLFVGGGGDLGYLATDDRGGQRFESLLPRVPANARKFGRIRWMVEGPDGGIHFMERQTLFRWRPRLAHPGLGEMQVWRAPDEARRFRDLSTAQGRVLVAQLGVGLQSIEGDDLRLVPGGEALAELEISDVVELDAESLLIATLADGLYVLSQGELSPWTGPGADYARDNLVMGLNVLSNGRLAVATLRGGVAVLDRDGRLTRVVDRAHGLPDDGVLNRAWIDRQDGLWLPLNYGVARVALGEQLDIYDHELGFDGTALSFERHDGALFVGTSQGLFRLTRSRDPRRAANFRPVAGVGRFSWDLLSLGDLLLVASGEGLLGVRDGRRVPRPYLTGTALTLTRSRDGSHLFVGTLLDGLHLFRLSAGRPVAVGALEGTTGAVRAVVEDDEGDLWLRVVDPDNTEHVDRVRWSAETLTTEIERFDGDDGLPPYDQLEPFWWRGVLYVAAAEGGLYRFEPSARTFARVETVVAGAQAAGAEFPTVDAADRLWLHLGDGRVARIEKRYDELEATYPLPNGLARSYLAFYTERGGSTVWTGTDDGRVVRLHGPPAGPTPERGATRAAIRRVAQSDGATLYGGSRPPEWEPPAVPHANNSSRFEYSLPSFSGSGAPLYQTRLIGLGEAWSVWSPETYRDFTALREGRYRFEVRGRDAYGVVGQPAQFSFRVMPPWYWTWWALGLFALAALALVRAALAWNERRTQQRLSLLEAEVRDRRRIERELRDSQRLLTHAQRIAQLGSWRWDARTDLIDGSSEFFSIYGLDYDGPIRPEAFLERIHPEDRQRVQQIWLELMRKGSLAAMEYRVVLPDGSERVVFVEGEGVADEEGRVWQMVGAVRDITERRRFENALRESDERYRAFIALSLEGLARFELRSPVPVSLPRTEIVELIVANASLAECNEALAAIYGHRDSHHMEGLSLADLAPHAHTSTASWLHEFVDAGFRFSGETEEIDERGRVRYFLRTATGIVEDGMLIRVWSTQLDVEERKKYEHRLEHLASFDPLTELPNRVLFEDRMTQGLAQARRTGEQLAVHYLDLDNFKNVNDTLGHGIGDELLAAVSRRLATTVREADTVARLGGDEFAILQTGVTNSAGVTALARKILDALTHPFRIRGHEIHTGATIGIALSAPGIGAEDLLTQSDTALNKSKERGRGGFQFHSDQMAEEVKYYVQLTQDLHGATDRGELALCYQPQVDLATGGFVGAEALVRWNHPERGFLSPGQFIAISERSGQIVGVGLWVLETACRQRKVWLDEGYGDFPISVNLSAVQLKDPRFADKVKRVLDTTRMPPNLLEFELTETTLMERTALLERDLSELHELGVRFCIDDFGTGYSSLQYVRSMPVSRLKIAREFVQGVTVNSDDTVIVEAVLSLGRNLGLKVLAEGVETAEEARFLRRHRCDQAQGFYFAAPQPVEEMVAWLDAAQSSIEPGVGIP